MKQKVDVEMSLKVNIVIQKVDVEMSKGKYCETKVHVEMSKGKYCETKSAC